MPWKNGGGETMEVAVLPQRAGLSDFDWRVSMARIDRDGPFSSFPGMDRTLAVLDGAGILLEVEGQETVRLARGVPPHAFAADVAATATLIDGPVTDLNVMSRRGGISHGVTELRDRTLSRSGGARLVLCSEGAVEVSSGDQRALLGSRDAVLLAEGDDAEVTPGDRSVFYLVTFNTL